MRVREDTVEKRGEGNEENNANDIRYSYTCSHGLYESDGIGPTYASVVYVRLSEVSYHVLAPRPWSHPLDSLDPAEMQPRRNVVPGPETTNHD